MAPAPRRPEPVLGQHGEVGIVLDEDRPAPQSAADQLGPVDSVRLGQVGSEAQPPLAIDHAGRAHADRRRTVVVAGALADAPGERAVELVDHGGHGVGDVAAHNGAAAARGGQTRLGHDVIAGTQGHAQDLGPADVDAVRRAGALRWAGARVHEVDSILALRSRSA